jgi:formimidoylglutamate deiminase
MNEEGNVREWSREKIPEGILTNARFLRSRMTEAEKLLWPFLKNRKLDNRKFRRQQPMEGFILDFYCDAAKLGIELDGQIHSIREISEYDEQRTKFLKELGIEIIRFSNDEVLKHTDQVLSKIKQKVDERIPSPLPLSPGRGVSEGRGEGIKYFQFQSLLQHAGWLTPAYVGVDENGIVKYLSDEAPEEATAVEFVNGFALPGFQNAHSHAFQYAMAGLAETHATGTDDDFWTWREEMYKCALSVNPDQAQAIAAMLYAEMARQGYTHVAEFHYLHHDKDGKPYANLAEMGLRMVEAAKAAGIKITLVPVFYQKGGFGQDPQPRQRRFISGTVDDYFHLLDDSAHAILDQQHASLGFSVHSLRAVDLRDVIQTYTNGPKEIPFHIHVAEQKKEVQDCLDYSGKRPMQWMLENLPVNERFHLVHSTHLNDDEVKKLATSKANVVLCPSTEGNLGDGIFRMKEFVRLGGHWTIGTDSHIGLNPFEEFRMIDYRQRLVTNLRNTFEGDAARYLIGESVLQGRAAMGRKTYDFFETGQSFDSLVINAQTHLLADTSEKNRLASIMYTSDSSRNLGTIVNGKWVVKNQHHVNGHAIKTAFSKAMKELKNR